MPGKHRRNTPLWYPPEMAAASHEQIAKTLGLSISQVERTERSAKRKLRANPEFHKILHERLQALYA